MQQTLFLMVGYPGAGKTTVSKLIHAQTGAVHMWADQERKRRFGYPDYSHPETIKLYSQLNQEVDALLAAGKSVIFDTNFNLYKDREKLRRMTAMYDVRTIVVWVIVPKTLAQTRAVHEAHGQENRVFGNMPLNHFNRIVRHLQPPRENERVIKFEGAHVTAEDVAKALKQLEA